MRGELSSEDLELAWDVFRKLMDDVEVGIGLDEAAWRCTDRRAHVREEEAAVRLGNDVVRDRS